MNRDAIVGLTVELESVESEGELNLALKFRAANSQIAQGLALGYEGVLQSMTAIALYLATADGLLRDRAATESETASTWHVGQLAKAIFRQSAVANR